MANPEMPRAAAFGQMLYLDAVDSSNFWHIRVSIPEMIDALDRFAEAYPKLCSFVGYDEEFSYFAVRKSVLAVTLTPPAPVEVSLVCHEQDL